MDENRGELSVGSDQAFWIKHDEDETVTTVGHDDLLDRYIETIQNQPDDQ